MKILLSLVAGIVFSAYAANAQILDDYPIKALHNHEQGLVKFHLEYAASGVPTSCVVTTSSGYPDLDDETCDRMIQRARFKPHFDEKGNVTSGTFDGAMRWVLPH